VDSEQQWTELRVDRHGVVTVCMLNRPHRLNAVSAQMNRELAAFWKWFESDHGQRVAVITGMGDKGFCTGADVVDVLDTEDPSTRTDDVFEVINQWVPHALSKPVICAVNGICAGGGLHFVTSTDFAIAADTATFMDPHVSVGHVSGIESIGLTYRMPVPAVLRMALVGRYERLSAQRALELGLVTEVVPQAQLLTRAIELAELVSKNSPAAVAGTRAAIRASIGRTEEEAYRYAWTVICEHARAHPDAAEGPRAYRERREPVWRTDANKN
jgi:enoyl-CoA hydratase/carnithine racemase